MGAFAELATTIRANLDGGRPPLHDTPIAQTRYAKALEAAFDPGKLTIGGAQVHADADRIEITGTANLLGLSNVAVSLGFRQSRGRCFFCADVSLSLPGPLQPLAAFGSPLQDTAFNWQFGPIALEPNARQLLPVSSYGFSGSFALGDSFRLPVNIAPAGTDALWRLSGDFDALPLSDLGTLLTWFAGKRTLPELPPGFNALTGLQLCNLGIGIDSTNKRISDAGLTIATNQSWPLLKQHLSLERISLTLGYRVNDANSQITTGLHAVFDLDGQTVPVDLSVAGGHVRLATRADDLQLPGLRALAELAGHPDLLKSVPEPVAAITELVFRGLTVDVDATQGQLTHLDAHIACVQPFGPVQGVLLDSTDFELSLDPAAQPAVGATLRALLAAGDDYLSVYGQLDGALQLSGTLDDLPLTALAKRFVPDLPDVFGDLQLHDVYLQFGTTGEVEFSAGVSWDLHTALQALGLPPLPEGTASIQLSSLELSSDLAAKTWRIALTPRNTFSFPASGAHRIAMSAIQVMLANDGFGCQFTLDGDATIGDGFGISAKSIVCRCQTASKDWHLGGELTVELLGRPYPFEPRIDVDADSASLVLKYADRLPLSPWPVYAAVDANEIEISLAKEDASGDHPAGYRWGVRGDAHFDIAGGFVVADGGLEFTDGALQLCADVENQPSIELSAIPGKPRIYITLKPLALTLGGKGGDSLSVGGSVTIKGVPGPADAVFPDGTSDASLQINSKGFAIAFKPLADPKLAISFLDVHLPDIEIQTLLLRQTKAGADDGQWQLGAELQVSGLAQLNQLFGNADLFTDSVDLLLGLGEGLSMALNGPSPLKAVRLLPPRDDGSVWTDWLDVVDTGRFSLRVPDFAFDFADGRWHASGGVVSQGELSLPLGLIKRALAPIRLDRLLAAMPDRLPLAELDLTGKDLYTQFERMLGKLNDPEATVFKRLVELLQQGLDRLPANMREYLKVSIPNELTFDASVEPTGGYAFGIRTKGDPLRLLLPWMSLSGPGLLGATIHHLSLGLSGGGSVAVVKSDAYFDHFDALGLIYALVTGKGEALSNRFAMRETTALAPVAAPFPLPLFYQRFGWSYHDFLGIKLEAHAAFGPLEEPPLSDWIHLIELLVDFFSKPDWYLHKHDIPKSMQLPFTLDPTFLALPSYLGGGQLGSCDKLPTLSVAQTLAHALDGIKAGNIGWIIQAVPLRHPDEPGGAWIRVGSQEVPFGPLEIDAAWCISTQHEFQNVILKDPDAVAMLAKADAGKMLTCLPSHYGGASYDKGYVILLMGGLKVGSPLGQLFHFQCQFGMAAMGPRDFETALRLVGGFGPDGMLELGIEGRIKTDVPLDRPDSTHVHVHGTVYLTVGEQRFALGGHVDVVSGVSFAAGIGLELTQYLLLDGELKVTTSNVTIDGSVTVAGTKLGTSATFGGNGVIFDAVKIDAGVFDAKAVLQFPGRSGSGFSFWAGLDLPASFTTDFRNSLVSAADTEVTSAIDSAFNDLQKVAADIKTFEASLTGLQGWLPGLCRKIIGIINKRTTDAAITKAMWAWSDKPSRRLARWGRKAAVRAAVTAGNPGGTARTSAAPWIKKLQAVEKAASQPIDQQYKAGLQKALNDLIATNHLKVTVSFGGYSITAYEDKQVIPPKRITEIRTGIDYIGKLPAATTRRASFQAILDKAPREQLLAEVRADIKQGMQGIPAVESVGFEASAGFSVSAVDMTIAVSYRGRDLDVVVPTDLTQPQALPGAVAKAFADAYAKA